MNQIKESYGDKKIAFFDFAHLSYGGGCEQNFMNLGKWFSNRGYEITFVTTSISLGRLLSIVPGISLYKSNISESELKERLGPSQYLTFGIWDLFFPTKNRTKILNVLKHSDNIISKNEIFEVFLLKYIFRINFSHVVFGIHTPLYYPVTRDLKSRLHNKLYSSNLYLNLLKNSRTRFLTLNDSDKNLLNTAGMKKVTVIPNPLNTEKFDQKSYFKNDIFNVYFVGRMTEQKGVDILAQAINILARENNQDFKQMNFYFVGNGSEEKYVLELSDKYENCTFIGFKNDVVKYYKDADLVVVPSRYESFCYTVAEAQSSGVPVIASDISGPKDIMIQNITGWLIKPEDPSVLAASIKDAFSIWKDSFDTYIEFGKQGRKNILENFQEDQINLKLESFIFGNQ